MSSGSSAAETLPDSDLAPAAEEESTTVETPEDGPAPQWTTLGPDRVQGGDSFDAPAMDPVDREELFSYCRRGDYLGAGLLAVGRAFAGLGDCDPDPAALLVAHHVLSDSSAAPWPNWCLDPEAASEACERAPESSRLIFLSALTQSTRDGGVGDPLPTPAKKALLAAFNHLPELRTWLEDVLEAVSVPGLWEQVCRPESTRAPDVYKEARTSFLERYEVGLQHRNPNAAYIHRLDHYISRLPATKALHDHLKPDEPGPLKDEEDRQIRDLLGKRPEEITKDWLQSAIRPTAGGIRLKGNQQADLTRRASVYLERMNRAWRAAEAMKRSGPSPGDVERRRARFRNTLPAARQQSDGMPWDALFVRLTEGLLP